MRTGKEEKEIRYVNQVTALMTTDMNGDRQR